MRAVLLAIAAAIALIEPLGLALSSPVLKAPPAPNPRATPISIPAGKVRTTEAAFPNCPAPAVNGINVRAVKTDAGSQLTIFVVVQNVGNRPFFASDDKTTLTVAMGDRSLGTFAISKLAASEVKFFSVETTVDAEALPGDIKASLDFGPQAITGAVTNTLDCQVSDNAVTRRGQSIRLARG